MKKYEKTSWIYFGIVLLIILELNGISYLYSNKEYSYYQMTGIVIKKNYIIVTATEEERKCIYQNKILIFKDKKKKYEIIEDYGKVLKRNHKNYYQLLIKLSFSNNYKSNDELRFIIPKKKIQRIEIFKLIWGGD